MPIYEYVCLECGSGFEKLMLLSTPPFGCPDCGSTHLEQVTSAPAIQNTSSNNAVLNREYQAYNRRWKGNAYMPKPNRRRS